MSVQTPHGRNPILHPAREGVDCKSCWTCEKCERIPKADYPVKIDVGVCVEYRSVETHPHEPNECDEWEPR